MEIGPKDLALNKVILARRDTGEKKDAVIDDAIVAVKDLLEAIQKNLFERALERLKTITKKVETWEDFKEAIEAGNFVLAHWCGEKEAEEEIKKETGATIRCLSLEYEKEEGKCVKTGKPSSRRVIFAKSY